jgi:hypothetical protein
VALFLDSSPSVAIFTTVSGASVRTLNQHRAFFSMHVFFSFRRLLF